ncbi:hypothetical protein PVAND_017271 [Polypedilum vanderplanki]|uniref:F-box domain-containing protein n=1 Tax=Polypedilum vanderplanki TaxID=319348 RepID=A0A9J6BI79_POLVA|nr:hypothetical protein PVAND_017271 [Polypedilum vanderplanki]
MNSSESSINILHLPNEILIKILKLSENNKNISMTCKRFYDLVLQIEEKNSTVFIDYRFSLNPFYDLDNSLQNSSSINFYYHINSEIEYMKNFEEKLEYFLQNFGHKIKIFTVNREIENFVTKFLPLMPNLEELLFFVSIKLEKPKIEKFHLKLKKLIIWNYIELEKLEIFSFDELEIKISSFGIKNKEIVKFLKRNKNLKHLKLYENRFNMNIAEALKFLKLETLELFFDYDPRQKLQNCLKNQKNLKELSIKEISKEILTAICDNMKFLEKLNFEICENFPAKNLRKISKLENLKFLKINSELDDDQLLELSDLKMENLTSLDIKISRKVQLTTQKIEKLSENFKLLSFFAIFYNSTIKLETVGKIFENFNNLEVLFLRFPYNIIYSENDDEIFYKKCHKNEKLKSLTFDCSRIDNEKAISKFISDFPNLEVIGFKLYFKLQKYFETILNGFPKLKKIKKLEITQELLEKFLKYGEKIEEFSIDLNILKNPAEILKNYGISFEAYQTSKARVQKDSNFKVNILTYSFWKKFQILKESQRKPKNLLINSLSRFESCKKYDEIFIKSLKNFNKNITNLTIFGSFYKFQLKTFLENLPNVENLNFENFYCEIDFLGFYKNSEFCPQFYIEMSKIKNICVKLNIIKNSSLLEFSNLPTIFDAMKLPENTITSFKVFIKNLNTENQKEYFRNWIKKFIKNQQKLKLSSSFNFDKFIESCSSINLNSYGDDVLRDFKPYDIYEEKLTFFLQNYGYKVKSFTVNSEIKNFLTKFLPLMPNLEEIIFNNQISLESQEIVWNLKKIEIFCGIDLKQLDNFNFKELRVDLSDFYHNDPEIHNFLRKHKNIKILKIRNVDSEMTKALKLFKLEKLEIYFSESQMKNIGNILRNQKQIKELKFLQISREILTIICDNLKNLESLSFKFDDRTLKSSFKKLSKLNFLKSLEILSFMNHEDFEEFLNLKFENIENLTIQIFYNGSKTFEQIENFSKSFINLKSLSLYFYPTVDFKIIAEIFKKFNKLESLSLNLFGSIEVTENEEKEFTNLRHKNEKLKNLKYCINFMNIENLLSKFSIDFPNLESIFIPNFDFTKENLEIILESFPKFKIFDSLKITKELLETFLKHGKGLNEFYINLDTFNNLNEILQDYSIYFETWQTNAKVMREEEKKIEFPMTTYSHWKRLKTLMELKNELKNLEIVSINEEIYSDPFLFNLLESVGKNVTNLTIYGDFKDLKLVKILECLPNLEILNFGIFSFFKTKSNPSMVENTKIHSILFKINFINYSFEYHYRKIAELFDCIKFPDNSLENLKIIFKNFESFEGKENFRNFQKNHMRNQDKLTKNIEKYNEETLEYTFEFKNK